MSDASQFIFRKDLFQFIKTKVRVHIKTSTNLVPAVVHPDALLHVAEMNVDVPEKCTSDDILNRLIAPLFSGMGSFKFNIFDVKPWSIAKQVISLKC